MSRAKDMILSDIHWQARYFDECGQIQQGINTKDVVKMSRLICEALDAGATEEEIYREFSNNTNGRRSIDLAKRTRHLVMR